MNSVACPWRVSDRGRSAGFTSTLAVAEHPLCHRGGIGGCLHYSDPREQGDELRLENVMMEERARGFPARQLYRMDPDDRVHLIQPRSGPDLNANRASKPSRAEADRAKRARLISYRRSGTSPEEVSTIRLAVRLSIIQGPDWSCAAYK
jgi:hypothetical protein